MKTPQVLLFIILFIVSLGLSGTASQADEIDDLKKRLLFLESQKEIINKLDGMQLNIDGLRGKVDGFQKELDDIRVQYDLKASNDETKIYEYTWSANICGQFSLRLKVVIDTEELSIKATELKDSGPGDSWTNSITLKNGKYQFDFGIAPANRKLELSGYALPSGGKAIAYAARGSCDGSAKLVPVKN
jgi:hypothetical protein